MSFVSLTRQLAQKNNLQLTLNEFVASNSGMPVILDFLDNPFSASINPATSNTWGKDRYNSAVGFFNEFVTQQNVILGSNPATAGGYMRLLATLPDGTVWYDSQRNISSTLINSNTYDNFIAKTIGDNHNSRSAFLQAVLSEDGYGYEEKIASITGFKGARETRVTLRLGPNKNNVVSVLALSLNCATLVNP
jgi:hypothetical protein